MRNRRFLPTIPHNELLGKTVSAASRFEHACILTSNHSPEAEKELLVGLGSMAGISALNGENSFELLKNEMLKTGDWWFGHFSYDLKNEEERLFSEHFDGIGFPSLHFFRPEFLLQLQDDKIFVEAGGNTSIETLFQEVAEIKSDIIPEIEINQRTSKAEYISRAQQLIAHIHRGDIYEINYCIEFFAEQVTIDPAALFLKLNAIAQAPFSCLYKNGDRWLLCASPERFLQKKGSRIISQPIKGTRPRGKTTEEDERLKEELFLDPKERSENVMIVDLVRNDLSKSAKKGSVHVDELFSIHSFPTVHQMISTVSAELAEHIHPVDAIRNAFPMGSMTGAPKVRAMQLAEEFEEMKRGLYSGAVGYFTPDLDFDFNVVIRSIQYNSKTGYLSLMVGSALTANAHPEKEYEECLLKAKALLESLGATLKTK